jgi:hypothetical protein
VTIDIAQRRDFLARRFSSVCVERSEGPLLISGSRVRVSGGPLEEALVPQGLFLLALSQSDSALPGVDQIRPVWDQIGVRTTFGIAVERVNARGAVRDADELMLDSRRAIE